MPLANFHLELLRATYSGLEITGSVSTLNLYLVSTILDIASVATTVLLPSYFCQRCVSHHIYSCCYFGWFLIIFHYYFLWNIELGWCLRCCVVVYSMGSKQQCSCDGTCVFRRVARVMISYLFPIQVFKSRFCFMLPAYYAHVLKHHTNGY